MCLIGILVTVGGLGILCGLLFTLAIYAFPFFAGLWLGLAPYHAGAGLIGAATLALFGGGLTLVVGQWAFATVRSPLLRIAIAMFYALPALVAGYQVTLSFAHIGTPSETWRQLFALAGAVAIGTTAWMRLTRFDVPRSDRKATRGQERSVPMGAPTGV